MKKVCRPYFSVMAFVLMVGLALPFAASAEMVKKVDNFIVLFDQSGSMAQANVMAGHQKLDQAVGTVARFDQAVPNLGYNSGVAAFAPFKTISAPGPYMKGSVGSASAGFVPAFNHMTTMSDGLANVDPVIGKLSGKTALIVFTDGEWNEGGDPVPQAKALYDKYGSNLCIHVVSYADTPKGQQTVAAIRGLNGCSVAADGKSLESDMAVAQFAKDVLYDEVTPKPAPVVVVPPPPPAPEIIVVKEVITFNLLFGFDKYAITDEMIPVLEQAKAILEEDSAVNFVVAGHTDSTGPEAYNQGLSERRANSVKDWLVSNGIAAGRLEAIGFGETDPKYDNATKEGRKLNRRVELQSK
jgi:OOP family OmpA-OmpF porin